MDVMSFYSQVAVLSFSLRIPTTVFILSQHAFVVRDWCGLDDNARDHSVMYIFFEVREIMCILLSLYEV
jgi:hypothetical protein